MTVTAWCFREPGTAAAAVAVDQLRKHVDEDACLLWVDCDDPSEEEIATLAEQLGIHHLTAEDLVNANQRTKLERFADHFHVALHDLVFDGEVLQNREVDVVFSEGWLLSVRHSNGAEMAPAGKEALARFERQRGEHGSNDEGFLLWAILDVIVDRYFDVTTAIDERLDDIEDVVFDRTAGRDPAGDLHTAPVDRRVPPRRRPTARGARAAPPQGGRVHRRRGDRTLSRTSTTTRCASLDLIESQRELLTGLLEGHLAVQSNQMNRVMKATSSWGAILIASTLIAGIYGMNFRHMPELSWAFGYPFALR